MFFLFFFDTTDLSESMNMILSIYNILNALKTRKIDFHVIFGAVKVFQRQMILWSHLSPLTSDVVGAPQMTLQQYLSTIPCLPHPSANLKTPFLSIPWCYLPIFSPAFLSFLFLSLSPAELPSPCHRILRCDHTIWVSVSLPWLGDNHALQLHWISGFCCEHPRSSHGICKKCSLRSLLQDRISKAWILLSISAVKV